MIATAVFVVWRLSELPEKPPVPLMYRHYWMTDDWNTALVELSDIQRELEREEHWMMLLVRWSVKERSDIG